MVDQCVSTFLDAAGAEMDAANVQLAECDLNLIDRSRFRPAGGPLFGGAGLDQQQRGRQEQGQYGGKFQPASDG